MDSPLVTPESLCTDIVVLKLHLPIAGTGCTSGWRSGTAARGDFLTCSASGAFGDQSKGVELSAHVVEMVHRNVELRDVVENPEGAAVGGDDFSIRRREWRVHNALSRQSCGRKGMPRATSGCVQDLLVDARTISAGSRMTLRMAGTFFDSIRFKMISAVD